MPASRAHSHKRKVRPGGERPKQVVARKSSRGIEYAPAVAYEPRWLSRKRQCWQVGVKDDGHNARTRARAGSLLHKAGSR
jgi:hypothetical protein